jgi:hypothetical protein
MIAASISAYSAYQARSAALASRKTAQGQVLAALLSEFGTDEMAHAVAELVSWRKGSEQERRQTAEKKRPYRRPVSYYFQKVHELHKIGAIDDAVVRAVASEGQARLYLDIEPLEHLTNPQYGAGSFEFYARFYKIGRVPIGPSWRL